jgi:hypothetical protein
MRESIFNVTGLMDPVFTGMTETCPKLHRDGYTKIYGRNF